MIPFIDQGKVVKCSQFRDLKFQCIKNTLLYRVFSIPSKGFGNDIVIRLKNN